jgi:plasmid stabilization system protein ParE
VTVRPLRLHEHADFELNDAADYYDRESPGLGSAFLDEVDRGFDRIRAYPYAAAEVARGIRKSVLARFPYTLVYEVRDDAVRIPAIAHQRKLPYCWRGRLVSCGLLTG